MYTRAKSLPKLYVRNIIPGGMGITLLETRPCRGAAAVSGASRVSEGGSSAGLSTHRSIRSSASLSTLLHLVLTCAREYKTLGM
jgi:hypothetical protein